METSKNILKNSCLFRMVMRIMVLVALLGHSSVANSQYGVTYPVDINAMLTPPYGTCLTDYVGTNRFQCNVLMRDMHATGYKFRILMTVKDMASGRVMFSAQSDQHTVTPGKPVYMAEIGVFSEFFKAGNILSSTAYRDGCLNEGAYNFVFQVVDDNDKRRIPISKECVFPARLQAGGAPLLISPFTGTNIDCNQTIVNFSWQMPVVTGEQTKYLIEICPTDEGGNGLHYLGSYTPSANGSGPSQGYIHATSYMPMYQLIETEGMKLVPNTTYFWRVSIIDEFGNVKPNSTSEIDSFTYCYTKELEPYVPLKEPKVKAINGELDTVHIDTVKTEDNATKATWFLDDVRFKYQSYALDIRKKSQDTWTTYHIKINEGDTEEKNYYGLSNLKYNEPYEARMQYLLITDNDTSYAPFSDTITFVVPNPMDTADCGEIMAIKDCNGEKGRILKKYDTLYANGTPVVLDSIVYKAGDSTVISGYGVISFPILKNFKLKMSFNEVSVNCYGELVSGQVVSVYKESTGAIIDLNHLTGKGDGGGSQSTTERPDPTNYKDKDEAKEKMQTGDYAQIGDSLYTKDKDGNLVALGKPLTIPADNYTNNNTLDDDDVYCIFRNDTKDAPYIGFDADEHKYYRGRPTLGDHYTPTFSKQDGADFEYIIPYVASNPGRVVKLSATLEGRLTDEYDKESLKFIMPMSGGDYLELNAKKEGDKFIVDFPGGKNPDTNSDVYAIVKKGEKYVNVGKINIETYAWRTQKVKFVPVVNDYGVDEKAISETLNRIYGRFGITYEVTKDGRFNTEEINADFVDDFSVGSGILTKQSEDMKLLQRCYKKERDFNDSTAYLFLLNSAKENASIEGDMPQGQICGYIFMHSDNGTLSDGRLVAHELAHGIYKLDHVFEKAYKIPENSTDNLLDYNNGDQLAHFQWELIKNPGFAWALLESDEDNMFRDNQIFFDPDWRPFKHTQSSIIYYDESVKDKGVIPGLSLSKYGNNYVFNPNLHRYENQDVQNDVLTVQYVSENDLNGSDAVYLYYANPENLCESKIFKTTYDYVKKAKESIKNGSAFLSDNKNLKFIQYVNCIPVKSGLFELESEFSKGNLSLLKKLSHKTDVPLYEVEEIVDCLSSKVDSDYDEKLLGERLVDKLKVYEEMNGKKFRVVSCLVNSAALSQKSWNQLAEVVFEKSNLGPNDILVTVPYVHVDNIVQSSAHYPYYMVGYHCGSKVDVDFSKITGPYDNSINTDGVIRFISDLFTHTSKKWQTIDGVFASTNVVSTSVMSSTEDISGLNFNRQIRLWREKGFSKLQQIVQEGNDKISRAFFDYCFCVSNSKMSYNSFCDEARDKCNQLKLEYSAKAKEQLDLMYNTTQNSTFEDAFELYRPSYEYFLDIKEEFLLKENEKYSGLEIGKLIQEYSKCSEGDVLEYGYEVKKKDLRYIKSNAYSYIYTDAFNELREVLKGVKKTDAFKFKTDIAFNGEDYYWRPVDKVVYGSIDAASCLLGFVGFDFIADGVGLSYAVFRGDPLQASIYAISLAVEGPGAVTALKELKDIKKGKNSFFWEKVSNVEKTSAEDEIKRASDLIEGIKTVNDKLLDRFKTIAGNDPSLRNAYQNIFDSKLVAESVERRKFVEEFSEASDELLKKILQNDKSVDVWKASIKDGYAMSSNQRKALVSDFVDGSLNDLIGSSAVKINEEWIPTWKKLYKLNVDKNVRSCGECLETLKNAFSKYPDIDISNISRVLGPQKDPIKFVKEKYQTVKSEAHYRTLVGDFDNVPGVKKTSYVGNGLPKKEIKAPDDWNLKVNGEEVNLDLPDGIATTFTSAQPKKLAPGTRIYRVYGDGQYASGGFWTYDLPKNEAELYGGTAVQPAWNNHTRYVEYTVPEGVDVYVWEGPVARQPVIDGVTDGYCLEGGITQLYICRDVTQNVMGIEGKAGNDFVFGAIPTKKKVVEDEVDDIFSSLKNNKISLSDALATVYSWEQDLKRACEIMESAKRKGCSWYDDILKKVLRKEVTCDELTSGQINHLIEKANKYAKNLKDINGDMVFFATDGKEALRITKEGFLIMPAKGKRYPAREIWDDGYVDMRLNELKRDGVGFVMRKNQDLVNSGHDGQVPRKFVGNYKMIKEVIDEANGDVSYIAKKLDLGDYFNGSDELYFVKVDLNKGFTIDLPSGNEPGAYEFLWWTGGDTKNLIPEAVFVESGNLIHGKNWDKYLDFYGKENVVKVLEYNK